MSPCFEVSGLHFAYPGRPEVLRGAGFSLAAGERLAVTGANGAGKSTLLRVLVGLHRPSRGSVVAFGQARREEKDFLEVRRRAGYVFQDPDDQLFCPTVAEDVAFGPINLGKPREEVLRIVDDVLARLGLSDFRDRVTHKLSGGEKRLVSLATVLAMDPEVLLLDEPTNALDEATTKRLTDSLLGLPQAMIVVSHDAPFRRRLATRSLCLRDGVLTPDGAEQTTVDDL